MKVVNGDGSSGLGTGVVAIIVAVLLVPLVGLAVALVLWARRRTRMAAAASSEAELKGRVRSPCSLAPRPLWEGPPCCEYSTIMRFEAPAIRVYAHACTVVPL